VLPYPNQQTPAGSVATTVGWGFDKTGGHIQTHLMKVDMFVDEQQKCAAVHNITVHPTNICTYYPGGGKDQCSGDSGGPVLVDGVQVGVVSWSLKPCGVVYPSISTRVASYIDWIMANTDI
jgi:trypsin